MKPDRWIIRVVTGFPKLTLLLFFGIVLICASFIPSLKRDPTPYLLSPEHESRVNLTRLRQNYTGSNDGILVLLEARDTIFTIQTLSRIRLLTQAFENLNLITDKDRGTLLNLASAAPNNLAQQIRQLTQEKITQDTWMTVDEIKVGAESLAVFEKKQLITALESWNQKLFPIIKVTSLANMDNIISENDQLDVSPIYELAPQTPGEIKRIREKVLSNDLFSNIFVSGDERFTSIIIEIGIPDDQTDERYRLYQQVKDILKNQIPGEQIHYVAGFPVVAGALGEVMQQDTRRLFPLVLIIVIACLFFTFRRVKGIVIPLIVVILSLIVTLGIKAFFNIPLNIITTTLPVFILSIGVADGIHIFSEYQDTLAKGVDKKQSVIKTLEHLTMPVIMTSLTTAAAFYAISLTAIVQLKHFGLFVGLGTLVAMCFSLFFIPALLILLPEKTRGVNPGRGKKKHLKFKNSYSGLLISMTRWVVKRPVITVSITGTILIIALFGASKVKVDNDNAKYFLEDSDIYISTDTLNTVAAGSNLINFLITADPQEAEPFKNPVNLKHVNDLTAFLETRPKVGKVLGLTELIKRIHFVLNDEKEGFNRIPMMSGTDATGKDLISQLLLLYENAGGDTLSDFTDTDYNTLNLRVVLKTNSSHDIALLTQQVRTHVKNHFPPHLHLDVSGSANVALAATSEIVTGQVISLLVSLVVVFAMLLLTFRTISHATIAMVPLVMTITINFGIMGFLSIPLDIGTAIISSIVIGIGVDYGIHYLSRLRQNLSAGMDFSTALDNTVIHSGKAIVSNAFTVGLGFIALWFSILTPLIIMGWMISVTMLVSALCTMVLIPVLIICIEKRQVTENETEKQPLLAFNAQQQN